MTRVPAVVHRAFGEAGRPLDASLRAGMESRLGHDFSAVRAHTGPLATASARAIGALAYTSGQHVVFGEGIYPPNSREAMHVVLHELTHVAQQRRDLDRPPDRVGAADDRTESHAEEVARALTGSGEVVNDLDTPPADSGVVRPYRSKKAFNFGRRDTASLIEQEFVDPKTQPWIEQITLTFDATKVDSAGDTVPTGTLEATYHVNPAALPNIRLPITGGSHKLGLTDRGTGFKVRRIEGVGYSDVQLAPPEGEGPRRKYARSLAASMSYAIFFHGGQAIHIGDLNTGSHACAHGGTDTTAWQSVQQLNYHSVVGRTKVDVTYNATALEEACCARIRFLGVTKKGGAPNPCNRQDPAACP